MVKRQRFFHKYYTDDKKRKRRMRGGQLFTTPPTPDAFRDWVATLRPGDKVYVSYIPYEKPGIYQVTAVDEDVDNTERIQIDVGDGSLWWVRNSDVAPSNVGPVT